MTEQNLLSSWPPLFRTKADPKPPQTGAYAGYIASINRRVSSSLQQFVLHNPQPNTSLHKKYRWCMHHSPPTICSSYTTQLDAVALPAADLDSRGGGWRLFVQICHHCAAFAAGGNLCICLNYCVPQNSMSTQQSSENVPKMIQQSKWLGGGPNSRKSSGGWGIHLHIKVNMLWGGYSWHTFANLGILPPHNILQSTQNYSPVGAVYYRGE